MTKTIMVSDEPSTGADPSEPVSLQVHNQLLVFPALARQINAESWRIEVEGVIYQSRQIRLQKRMLLRILRRYMKVGPVEFSSPLFQERVEAFVADTERGLQPEFRLPSGLAHRTRPTLRNGRFSGVLLATHDQAGVAAEPRQHIHCRSIDVHLPELPSQPVSTPAFFVPPQGVSLVSDIDDTIKETNVRQRREMLINTFLRPFRAIDGMSEAYRELAELGIMFHYVSSSPWQLYRPLFDLLETEQFPAGSVHLRNFRLRDHMLRRVFLLHRRGKGGVIRALFEMFPQRRFLLVGDSGERDPKIYAGLARRFPDQVLGIMIRILDPRDEVLLRERFAESRWLSQRLHTFSSPEEFRETSRRVLETA